MKKNVPAVLGRTVSCALTAALAAGCVPAAAFAQVADADAASASASAAQRGASDAVDVALDGYDRANLPAGAYDIGVSLNAATTPDVQSMAGGCVAGAAQLEVAADGTYSVVISLQTINIMGIYGDITAFYYYPSGYVQDGVPYYQGEAVACDVLTTRVADHDGATYPATVRVPVTKAAIADGYVAAAAVNTGMGGAASNHILKLDWKSFDIRYGGVGAVDKSALDDALAQAKAVPAGDSLDYVLLSRAIASAETVQADEDATQQQVDEQATALAQALSVYNGVPLTALAEGHSYSMPIQFMRADGSSSMAGSNLANMATVAVPAAGDGPSSAYRIAVTTTAESDGLVKDISYGEGGVAAESVDNGDGTHTYTLLSDVATHALKVSFDVQVPGMGSGVAMSAYAVLDTARAVDLGVLPGPDAPAAVSTQRLAGDDSWQTSAAVSAEAFSGETSDWVVIARADDFADAMSATGLAGQLNAPILLADREAGLSSEVSAEISRLGATHAYIVGGKGAIPADIEGQLVGLGMAPGDVERVSGDDYHDTSVECARKIVAHGGATDKAIVAYGQNFQDALSMSSFAYKYGVPIFLQTPGDVSSERSLNADALALLTGDGAFSGAKVFVAGGEGAVSAASVEGVFGADLRGGVRLAGEDGYDTSNQVARWMTSHGAAAGETYLSPETVTIACGALAAHGVDALAGAALAGKAGGVLLLANGSDAPSLQPRDATVVSGKDSQGDEAFLASARSSVKKAYVLGGSVVMPEAFVSRIDAALAGEQS